MRRRSFLAGLSTAFLPRGLAAQHRVLSKRIGWLTAQRPSSLAPYLDAFRAGLSELGYTEGRNCISSTATVTMTSAAYLSWLSHYCGSP